MGTLYERLLYLCNKKGVSGSRMCLDLGLSKSTMSDLKYGRTKSMSAATAQKIAGYFEITVDELYGIEDEQKEKPIEDDGLSKELQALIEFAKSVPEDKAEMILRVMKSIVETD